VVRVLKGANIMPLSSVFQWLSDKARGAGRARNALKAYAEKALAMKKQAGDDKVIPPHQTAHEGMQRNDDADVHHANRGGEAGFTPQLKRSRVARSGDT
jgi:hypothetical protein